MNVGSLCVGVIVFMLIIFITYIIGWFRAFFGGDDEAVIFNAWIFASFGFAVCLTFILAG